MTDAPRTTSLFPNEWRSLCVGSAQQLANFFAGVDQMTPDNAVRVDEHLARLQMFVSGWKAIEPVREQQGQVAAPTGEHTNGAAEPKRRGGWPKGKPRKPAEQQPSVTQ